MFPFCFEECPRGSISMSMQTKAEAVETTVAWADRRDVVFVDVNAERDMLVQYFKNAVKRGDDAPLSIFFPEIEVGQIGSIKYVHTDQGNTVMKLVVRDNHTNDELHMSLLFCADKDMFWSADVDTFMWWWSACHFCGASLLISSDAYDIAHVTP